jgi:hypothetical protein
MCYCDQAKLLERREPNYSADGNGGQSPDNDDHQARDHCRGFHLCIFLSGFFHPMTLFYVTAVPDDTSKVWV